MEKKVKKVKLTRTDFKRMKKDLKRIAKTKASGYKRRVERQKLI